MPVPFFDDGRVAVLVATAVMILVLLGAGLNVLMFLDMTVPMAVARTMYGDTTWADIHMLSERIARQHREGRSGNKGGECPFHH